MSEPPGERDWKKALQLYQRSFNFVRRVWGYPPERKDALELFECYPAKRYFSWLLYGLCMEPYDKNLHRACIKLWSKVDSQDWKTLIEPRALMEQTFPHLKEKEREQFLNFPCSRLPVKLGNEEMLAVAGVFSFHPSGFLREEALNALSLCAPLEKNRRCWVQLVAMHLQDWVEEISCLATQILESLLKKKHWLFWTESWSWLRWLYVRERSHRQGFWKLYFRFLSEHFPDQEPDEKFLELDLVFWRCLEKEKIPPLRWLLYLLDAKDSQVCGWSSQHLKRDLLESDESLDIEALLQKMVFSSSRQVRERACELACLSRQPRKWLRHLAQDSHRGLGHYAGYLFEKHGSQDPKTVLEDLWRSYQETGEVGWLAWYCDRAQTKEQAQRLYGLYEESLSCYQKRLVVRSLARIFQKEALPFLLKALSDKSFKVFRKTVLCIIKINPHLKYQELRDLLVKEKDERRFKFLGKLLKRTNFWDQINLLLEMYLAQGEGQESGKKRLLNQMRGWNLRYNSNFISPEKEQRELFFHLEAKLSEQLMDDPVAVKLRGIRKFWSS